MLECHIPSFPAIDTEYLIFRWKTGYFPKGSGPRVAFIHREKTELVTALEIQKAIRILDIDEDIFWQHADNCMVDATKPQAGQSTPGNPSDSK